MSEKLCQYHLVKPLKVFKNFALVYRPRTPDIFGKPSQKSHHVDSRFLRTQQIRTYTNSINLPNGISL